MFAGNWSSESEESEDIKYLMSRDFTKPHDWGVTWLCEWELFMIWHHLSKFGSHKYCSSKDVYYFVTSSCKSTWLKCQVATTTDAPSSGYKTALVCHVMSQDHIIKGSCDKVGAYRGKLSSCKIWWPKASGSGDIMVYVSSPELARPRNHRVMRLYG